VVFSSLLSHFGIRSEQIPSFGGPAVVDDEEADQDALRHLRNRAVAIGNVELLALIKEIDTRFYDIHTGIKNAK